MIWYKHYHKVKKKQTRNLELKVSPWVHLSPAVLFCSPSSYLHYLALNIFNQDFLYFHSVVMPGNCSPPLNYYLKQHLSEYCRLLFIIVYKKLLVEWLNERDNFLLHWTSWNCYLDGIYEWIINGNFYCESSWPDAGGTLLSACFHGNISMSSVKFDKPPRVSKVWIALRRLDKNGLLVSLSLFDFVSSSAVVHPLTLASVRVRGHGSQPLEKWFGCSHLLWLNPGHKKRLTYKCLFKRQCCC